jgi:HupE / UreJ protein
LKNIFTLSFVILFALSGIAHPMPTSVVLLDIKQGGVAAEIQLPLGELGLAIGRDFSRDSEILFLQSKQAISDYLLQHFRVIGSDGSQWSVAVSDLGIAKAEQSATNSGNNGAATGIYQELIAHLWLKPNGSRVETRKFTLYYDVIIHQVVTHRALLSVRQDFDNGLVGEHSTELGTIQLDPKTNTISPVQINLSQGSIWKGFQSMLSLGAAHIAEGTDHLLFLLVLLLAAPMIAENKRWTSIGNTRYSLVRLLKIVTAFTIGHSVTLVIAAVGWLKLPAQPVEILIAVSILITAIHALRPIFPKKEIYVAAGFGLIHGLAFATVLTNLYLDTQRMVLSVLGFNIGIELMQLFVLLLTMPWLILISKTRYYKYIRVGGALFAALAALAWIVERVTNKPNIITTLVGNWSLVVGRWIILGLAIVAIVTYFLQENKRFRR